MKIKKSILDDFLEENEKEEKEQNKLKEKYKIEEEVKIVEKSNTIKFIIKTIINGGKLMCSIIFIFLAFVGLTSLIHPTIRIELINILNGVLNELKMLINV